MGQRWKFLLAIILVMIILGASFIAYRLHVVSRYIDQIQTYTMGIGHYNRRQVAVQITDALNEYYSDHGEYPPYLYGGPSVIALECSGKGETVVIDNPDPLVAGGYLPEYPRLPEGFYIGRAFSGMIHGIDSNNWSCAYSTPGDDVVFNNYCQCVDDRLIELSQEIDPSVKATRRNTLACREIGETPEFQLYNGETCGLLRSDIAYYGYQRGEWLNSDESLCWLWFYGDNRIHDKHGVIPKTDSQWRSLMGLSWKKAQDVLMEAVYNKTTPQAGRGLDLINSGDGSLQPDGIPDGICFLYKLREGKVAEVIEGVYD